TKIHVDNESAICVVKKPVNHSKTKHIEIRHHFIRDFYEKRLIEMVKIHTDYNVADLLTKAFDVTRYRGLYTNEVVHKELVDRKERAATTASSLEAEQDSGSGPKCQDTILGDVDAQTRFETTSKQFNDPPLSRGYTLRSGEDSMKLLELSELFNAARPNLVLPVQVYCCEGDSYIRYALTFNPTIYTSCIKQFWSTAKAKMVNSECQIQDLIDKNEVPLKRKDQIALDEQIARDIQAKLDAELLEEQKLARKQEEEANIALIESWENTQAMMEADRLLAERLQSKEREELTDEEKELTN
ncbi:hypothetical protein Tco_0436156, partial [Tanacetum coccineum]